MAAAIQVYETTQGVFVIARNFRVSQQPSDPEFRGSFAHRRTLYEVWGRNRMWVRIPAAAQTFASFAKAAEYLEENQLELEVT